MTKKGKGKEPCKQICEYQNQIAYKSLEEVEAVIKRKYDEGIITDYAYIVHDKDTYTKEDEETNPTVKAGMPKKPHIHAYLRLNNTYNFSTIANWFEVPVGAINTIKKSFAAGCAYAIHKNNPEKYQYPIEEVHSSFNYAEFINGLIEKEKQQLEDKDNAKKLKKRMLMEVENGTLRGYNFHERYSFVERVLYRKFLDSAIDEIVKTKIHRSEDRQLEVIYIHGASGAGKTTYAKQIGRKRFKYCAISGEDRDPCEAYDGEPCMILDELRPSSMKLANFLKLVDNNTESMAGARYHGKAFIECRLIIITSTLPIEDFFKKLQENDNETAVQIKRRCRTMFDMSREYIEINEWDDYNRQYVYVGKKKNPIPELYKIEPRTVEELRARACEVAGFDISELDIMPKVEVPEGLVGPPIPLAEAYPTIPSDEIEKMKNSFPYLEAYLAAHPEHKPLGLK